MKFMKSVLTSVGESKDRDGVKYVRKHWMIFAAYYFGASLIVGLGIAAMMFVFAVLGLSKRADHKPMPVDKAFFLAMGFLIAVTVIIFFIQLISGPLVFTRDVVCRKCRMRQRMKGVPFFGGKRSRANRCECGGKVAPACLWKADVSNPDSTGS